MSIQILPDQYGLGEALPQLGNILGSLLQQRGVQQQQRKSGNILSQILQAQQQQESPDLMGGLAEALAMGASPDIVAKFGTLGAQLSRGAQKSPFGEKSESELSDLFESMGMPKNVAARNAKLYGSLTTGGQTAFAQQLMEQMQRGTVGNGGLFDIQDTFSEQISDPLNPNSNIEIDESTSAVLPELDIFSDLTPKEKVTRQNELFKTNSKDYKETQNSLKNYNTTGRSLRQLTDLNNSGKMPKGLLKAITIDWKNGKAKISPSLLNEESQLYVKTINQFIKGAKESFGARVTNFELDAFLQQLPTLSNTEEGRRLILEQMQVINDIDKLSADSQKEVYNKYGLYNIDPLSVDVLATKLRGQKEAQLEKRYDDVLNAQRYYRAKQQVPAGQIAVEINGELGYVPADERELAIRKGAKIL